MAHIRFQALKEVSNRKPHFAVPPTGKVSDYYGCNVFDFDKMRKYLSKEAYDKVVEARKKSLGFGK